MILIAILLSTAIPVHFGIFENRPMEGNERLSVKASFFFYASECFCLVMACIVMVYSVIYREHLTWYLQLWSVSALFLMSSLFHKTNTLDRYIPSDYWFPLTLLLASKLTGNYVVGYGPIHVAIWLFVQFFLALFYFYWNKENYITDCFVSILVILHCVQAFSRIYV